MLASQSALSSDHSKRVAEQKKTSSAAGPSSKPAAEQRQTSAHWSSSSSSAASSIYLVGKSGLSTFNKTVSQARPGKAEQKKQARAKKRKLSSTTTEATIYVGQDIYHEAAQQNIYHGKTFAPVLPKLLSSITVEDVAASKPGFADPTADIAESKLCVKKLQERIKIEQDVIKLGSRHGSTMSPQYPCRSELDAQ